MLSRTAERFLFGLQSHDLRAFAAAIVTLLVAGLLASVIPARRAASVDPMEALRAE
jgi:ABC-type lipoprotein release transport system permease subunit